MEIRRQLQISAWLFAAVFLGVIASVLLAAQEVDRALARSKSAADISTNGLSGLRAVTVDYVLNREPRALAQWQRRHARLRAMLATELYEDTARQDLLRELRRNAEYLGELFPQLVQLYAEAQGAELTALQADVEARLTTQLMVVTQAMVADSAMLLQRSQDRLRDVHRVAGIAAAAGVVFMALLVSVNLYLAKRRVLDPLRVLRRGAEIVGSGDLAHRTQIADRNEIGDLSRAFDTMAAQLGRSRRQLEENALRLQDAVRELESFSYSVSHDLRAPLRGIDGWSLALQEDYGSVLDAKGSSYLDIVRAETQRMGHLIDDLLKLSRVSQGELVRERVDLSALAHTIAGRLRSAHPGRDLDFRIAPGLTAQADPRLLDIALSNLMGNACKFSAPRQAAVIEFGAMRPGAQQPPATPGSMTRPVFFVRDNGVGFDTTHASRLFGAFQRLHAASEFPGSGIGLATTQRIVLRHGGRIWAESQPGQGATFFFTLEAAT